MTTVHFLRTDHAGPDFREFLTLFERAGELVIQVSAGDHPGSDVIGIFSLDGERLNIPKWEADGWRQAHDVNPDVIAEVEQDWAGASLRVQRCDSHGEVIGGG